MTMRNAWIIAVVVLMTIAVAHAQTFERQFSRGGRDIPVGDPARGRALAEQHCTECHTLAGGGRGLHRPNLSGQNEAYMVKQMLAFQASAQGQASDSPTGWRWHPRLGPMLAGFKLQDLADLAAHFGGQACIQPTTQIRQRPEIVERCTLCHGPEGTGLYPVVPKLASQKELYLLRQLDAFRGRGKATGTGENQMRRSNPMMDRQAHLLSESDIILLAAYFSSVPCR